MRIVHTRDLEEDAILARTIFDPDGRPLLARGVPAFRYRQRLLRHGIVSVYVRSPGEPEAAPSEVVREETRLEAMRVVSSAFRLAADVDAELDIEPVRGVVQRIVDEVASGGPSLIDLLEIRAMGDHTFAHSVFVCVLSVMIGKVLGYDESRLRTLGLGALLHDVGKAHIPSDVWAKSERLTPDEARLVQAHPALGYRMLKSRPTVSLISAHVAYQHHERLDGSGYPRGLSGDDIHESARIVGVADVYDALTTDRPYRPRVHPSHALQYLTAKAGELFDRAVVRALGRCAAPFPLGTTVTLSNGETARVVRTNPDSPYRPVVAVVGKEPAGAGAPFRTRDLAGEPDLIITRVHLTSHGA